MSHVNLNASHDQIQVNYFEKGDIVTIQGFTTLSGWLPALV